MSTNLRPLSFSEFWPRYLAEHLHPANRWLHFVGTSMAIGLCTSWVVFGPWMLLIGVVVGYSFAWVGHFFVEGNRPASFGHPFYSFAADFKMWSHMLRGTLEVEMLRAGLLEFEGR